MREDIQMRNAVNVIDSYNGQVPLQIHIKNYCKENKNLGSKDRKILTELVYGYFRSKGKLKSDFSEDYVVAGAKNSEMLMQFYNYWQTKVTMPSQVKNLETYFPLHETISPEIQKESFFTYLQNKPHVFIRCDIGAQEEVEEELKTVGYEYKLIAGIISFEKNYPLDTLKSFEEGLFEIQDIASQQVGTLFQPQKNESWWDCCAGAGGKSLLLLELEGQLQLFVSDVRESIIKNLSERFERHLHTNYNRFVVDLENMSEKEKQKIPQFNAVLADVPCSGSGTWGRTPEWLTYFDEEKLKNYIQLQRNIISAITDKVLVGGKIIYITCSVYADENENNITWFTQNLPLQLSEQKYFQCSNQHGDTLFAAVLKRI